MKDLFVVGGGWAGCASALAAAKKGLAVILIERTDRLLGSGLVGGIMRNNGRYTAAEELRLMGAGELIGVTDACSRHTGLDFPGHRHASLYDVNAVEGEVKKLLEKNGVELLMQRRVVDAVVRENRIVAVRLEGVDEAMEAGVFIDACGTAGPAGNCRRYGNGCAVCVYRCPAFGSRISLAVRAGAAELPVKRAGGVPGFFSGSCELEPESLERRLLAEIRRKGILKVPLPDELRTANSTLTDEKSCQQYSTGEFRDNIILLDTGAVKMMTPSIPLEYLRKIRGFERAVFHDPLAGGRGNSIRFSGVIRRDNRLAVPPLRNLFLAGERAGLMLGHTEAIITGSLAGYNAWLLGRNEAPLELPRGTAAGELVAWGGGGSGAPGESGEVCTLSGGALWEHLRETGIYTTDRALVRRRLARLGLIGLFAS